MNGEWQARVVDDAQSFASNTRRLIIFRHRGDMLEMVIGWSDDGRNAIVSSVPPGIVPDFQGFLVPAEAISSLVEFVKPGPSSSEIKRLEEALAVERRRVDVTLSAFLGAGSSVNSSIPGDTPSG